MSSRLGRERSGIFSSTNSDQNPVAARERKGKISIMVEERMNTKNIHCGHKS